ncbi:hypothetical protein SynMVIR181_01604 [Synechococcus sp. MVIR-18-1]|nr:hypothetical protein SynMVIR181_01604 [Synechococcus sp. MVIR-18-1]
MTAASPSQGVVTNVKSFFGHWPSFMRLYLTRRLDVIDCGLDRKERAVNVC